jgi:hypothetical protein
MLLNIERKMVYRELDAEVFYENRVTGARYRRIAGGLAWPGTKPGFAVIIGEDRKHDLDVNAHHLRLLAEVEEANIERLLDWCAGHQINAPEIYWIWYGDTTNKPLMTWIHRLNGKYRSQGRQQHLALAPAPYIDSPKRFGFHINILRECLERRRKTLHLGEQSKLPSYLVQLATEEVVKAIAEDYPAIAALGYAVSALTIWPDASLLR